MRGHRRWCWCYGHCRCGCDGSRRGLFCRGRDVHLAAERTVQIERAKDHNHADCALDERGQPRGGDLHDREIHKEQKHGKHKVDKVDGSRVPANTKYKKKISKKNKVDNPGSYRNVRMRPTARFTFGTGAVTMCALATARRSHSMFALSATMIANVIRNSTT